MASCNLQNAERDGRSTSLLIAVCCAMCFFCLLIWGPVLTSIYQHWKKPILFHLAERWHYHCKEMRDEGNEEKVTEEGWRKEGVDRYLVNRGLEDNLGSLGDLHS